jgi:hypothetical protein
MAPALYQQVTASGSGWLCRQWQRRGPPGSGTWQLSAGGQQVKHGTPNCAVFFPLQQGQFSLLNMLIASTILACSVLNSSNSCSGQPVFWSRLQKSLCNAFTAGTNATNSNRLAAVPVMAQPAAVPKQQEAFSKDLSSSPCFASRRSRPEAAAGSGLLET